MAFKHPHNEKSQNVKSGDRGPQSVRKHRLITRTSVNVFLNKSWTGIAICGEATSRINMIFHRQLHCWSVGIRNFIISNDTLAR